LQLLPYSGRDDGGDDGDRMTDDDGKGDDEDKYDGLMKMSCKEPLKDETSTSRLTA
jgi:hypothetical protein